MTNIDIQLEQSDCPHSYTELVEYTARVCEQLGLENYPGFVDIEFVDSFSDGAAGYCDGDADVVNVSIAWADNAGDILLDDMKLHIAHELIHAQQILSGRLENVGLALRTINGQADSLCNVVVFDGEEYINVAYDDQPWEKDAYAREHAVKEASL